MRLSANRLFISLFVLTEAMVLAMMSTSPAAGLLALFGLAVLPGAFILLLLKPGRLSLLERFLYAIGLSALLLMLSGLLTNQLVPLLFHNARPLAAAVQVPWVSGMALVLLGAAWWRNRKTQYHFELTLPESKALLPGAALALLPLLSALGATMLNNGGSNLLTMVMYALVAGFGFVLVLRQRRVPAWIWPWAVFTMSLALLWSTSLRGFFITGHDIQLEYYVFQITNAAQHWSMATFRDPYNACLSITILPTILKSLTGIGAIALYKVVYQIWFALGVTGVWLLSRRYLSAAAAFVGAFIFITFPTFVTDMPMLVRQEVAFTFFVALLLALYNRNLRPGVRRMLFVSLIAGMVLSHYSTTFVALAIMGGVYVWQLVARRFHRATVFDLPEAAGVTLGVVVMLLVSTVFWTGIYTKTGSNITATLTNAVKSLPTILQPKEATDSSAYTLIKSINVPNQVQLNNYVTSQHDSAEALAAQAGGFYANAAGYVLKSVNQPNLPITALGRLVSKLGVGPGTLVALGKQAYALALQGLILAGTGIVYLRRRALKLDSGLRAMAVVGIVFLGLQALLAFIDYGLFRLLQQELVFLVIPALLGAKQLFAWLRIRRERVWLSIIMGALALSFLVLSGFVSELLGGSVAALPLSNSGFYYDAYYTSNQDISTFAWIKDNYPAGYPINTDSFTRMKLLANTGITALDGITPDQITRQSYVVLTGINVTEDRVGLYYSVNGQLLFYQYPTQFLNSDKNLIYSTNSTRVYH